MSRLAKTCLHRPYINKRQTDRPAARRAETSLEHLQHQLAMLAVGERVGLVAQLLTRRRLRRKSPQTMFRSVARNPQAQVRERCESAPDQRSVGLLSAVSKHASIGERRLRRSCLLAGLDGGCRPVLLCGG